MEQNMRKGNVALCPEGAAAIAITAFSALIFAILSWPVLAVLCWILFIFSMHFFRDPERVAPQERGVACSPADGTVIRIEKRMDPFGGSERQCISIFMSIFNVHVNRAPVNCIVKAIRYHEGLFFNASFDKASSDNERCSWLLQGEDGEQWTLVQIAGLIARRIVCRAKVGEELVMGERIGMIRFGSRVDLYLPSDYSPAIETGARVYGGQTIIARKTARENDSQK